MEGPAAEEAERRREEAELPAPEAPPADRQAVYGSTADDPDARIDFGRIAVYGSTDDEAEQHFIGWLGEVDPDELFESGDAWGIAVVRVRDTAG